MRRRRHGSPARVCVGRGGGVLEVAAMEVAAEAFSALATNAAAWPVGRSRTCCTRSPSSRARSRQICSSPTRPSQDDLLADNSDLKKFICGHLQNHQQNPIHTVKGLGMSVLVIRREGGQAPLPIRSASD